MLEVISIINNLVAYSDYEMKPVYFISMCCVAIFWTPNIHSMFDSVTGSMHEMQSLRLNISDYYKNNMNSIDIIDHICNLYSIYHWM